MVTKGNDTILYKWNLLRVELKCFHQKEKENNKKEINTWGNVFVNSTVGILSQGVCASSHHIIYIRCVIILLVNYTSINLGQKVLWDHRGGGN